MRICLLVIACLLVASWSYGQPPTPGIPANKPNKQNSEPENNPKPDQRGTDQVPLVIKVLPPPPNEPVPTPSENQEKNNTTDWDWWWDKSPEILIAVFTLCLWLATKGLVTGADNTAKKQLRAYVAATPIKFIGPNELSMRFSMINYGQTPAYDVVDSALIDIFPYPLPPNFDFPELPIQQHSRTVLYPHATNISGMAPMSKTFYEGEPWLAGNDRIYVYGRVTYTDIFKESHVTEFCHSIPKTMQLVEFLRGTIPKGTPFDSETANQHDKTD